MKPKMDKKPDEADLTAMLEFTKTGYLKTVYLCASSDQAQKLLETAIQRLIKPWHWRWLRGLLKWG
ncbi:MAG: hypothetical protein JSU72_20310 [Deltaproteobacteria bacterium]|nr:MAG: hypothetical protein JSU72_20310 [Deltaproteobacteria bacterium]